MFVATNMTGIKKAKLFSPFPSDYVRSVLKKVGVVKRCFGYWPHELQVGRRLGVGVRVMVGGSSRGSCCRRVSV